MEGEARLGEEWRWKGWQGVGGLPSSSGQRQESLSGPSRRRHGSLAVVCMPSALFLHGFHAAQLLARSCWHSGRIQCLPLPFPPPLGQSRKRTRLASAPSGGSAVSNDQVAIGRGGDWGRGAVDIQVTLPGFVGTYLAKVAPTRLRLWRFGFWEGEVGERAPLGRAFLRPGLA